MKIFGKDKLQEIQESEKKPKQHTIMLVDDEEENLNVLISMFKDTYDLVTARDGREALEYFQQSENPERVKLIISDQRMPHLTGTQLFEKLIPGFPGIIRVILTGFTDVSAIIDSINRAKIYKFVIKPFDPHELMLTVERGIEAYELRKELDVYHRTLEEKVVERTRELKEKNDQITGSIRYAQTIQAAILPDADDMAEAFPGHFVIFKPRDIVSGDFYWFHADGDRVFLAVVDCTGHGVPGAFMSMMGYALLNKMIVEHELTDPASILEQLHIEVRRALKQAAGKGAADGMDMALCRIHPADRKVVFAGAKSKLYWAKKNDAGTEPATIKGDRKPIGGRQTEQKRTFTNHELQLAAGDMIYMASDGFTDQYDPDQKKYGSIRFRELLGRVSGQTEGEQKDVLTKELADHQGSEDQLDDITVIGVRL